MDILVWVATGRYMHYFMMVQNKHQLQKNTLVYDLLEGKVKEKYLGVVLKYKSDIKLDEHKIVQ
ncbi:MAG TPA: hypothetical protein EYP35_11135, partial [Desulfobacterales bacterium]|nr:hypothetical protein [Desulfobacterales bacterium]